LEGKREGANISIPLSSMRLFTYLGRRDMSEETSTRDWSVPREKVTSLIPSGEGLERDKAALQGRGVGTSTQKREEDKESLITKKNMEEKMSL